MSKYIIIGSGRKLTVRAIFCILKYAHPHATTIEIDTIAIKSTTPVALSNDSVGSIEKRSPPSKKNTGTHIIEKVFPSTTIQSKRF